MAMTSLENNGQDMDLTELEVMEPKMMIHDELKVIYINEALEEALNDENSNEKKKYDAEKAAHPDYVTRLRRLPVTIEFMKKYAALKKDSFMQDLIERKEPALRAEGELYEVSSFFAFKNMFLARYPECRNIYKVEKKIKEFEERQRNKE
ncbi:MAG: hypothetical protein ACLR5Q_08115 [Coprococcus sp.]|jgi:hypothetical protein|nr:hypothetical protein [Coprococcus catus]MCO7146208.1 hypothetical protein [Coprococcus catus]MCQ5055310.1 hypothetical protein [Agathobaculum butyriciproducens]MDD6344584.1 hypothetical protein [Coprococcus catus]MDY5988572.1 hypothetical protein [Coprococcus catus]